MVAASKPVSGQPLESTWGGQVHDVVVLARGVIVNGGTVSAVVNLPLDAVLAGDPTMVDLASNEFIAPVDGVYQVLATIVGNGQAAGSGLTYTAHAYIVGPGYQGISATVPSAGASVRRLALAGLIPCTAGQRVYLLAANAGSGGTLQIEKASWRLIAQGLGAA